MKPTRTPGSQGGKGRRNGDAGRHPKRAGNNGSQARNGANPGHSVERYLALAREAEAAGDIVQSQYYYQHAEHYLRKQNAKSGPTAPTD